MNKRYVISPLTNSFNMNDQSAVATYIKATKLMFGQHLKFVKVSPGHSDDKEMQWLHQILN